MINIKKSLLGCLLLSAAISAAVIIPTGHEAQAASASSQVQAQGQVGVIQASVNLRDKPSLSSNVLGYVKKERPCRFWRKARLIIIK